MLRGGARRTLAVAVAASLLASGVARADTAVKIAAVPTALLGAVALLMGCTSPNDGAAHWNRDGYYAALGGTLAIEDFSIGVLANRDGSRRGALKASESGGVNAALGYRCHPNVAFEGSAEWIAGFNLDGANKKKLTGVVTTLNTKVYLLTERIQPFLLMGIGAVIFNHHPVDVETIGRFGRLTGRGKTFEGREEDVALRIGGGIDLYATEQLAVSFGTTYVLPTDKLDDLSYVSITLGLQYKF